MHLKENNRNNLIDILRVISCLLVIFYHLDLLGSGYLSVCFFFTLSGYLAAKSVSKNDGGIFSFYLKRLKRVYLPLFIVVCLTILVFKQFPEWAWVSLKPESLSAFLSYNNFYRIQNESNYFACVGQSPFIHIWYVSLLMQMEIFLPIVHFVAKKISDGVKRILCFVLVSLSVACLFFFTYKDGFEVSYYHPLSRFFSYGLGVLLYLLVKDDGMQKEKQAATQEEAELAIIKEHITQFIFGFLLFAFVYIQIKTIDSISSNLIMMCVASVISVLLIFLSNRIEYSQSGIFTFLANISYELYLVHIPVMFFVKSINPGISNEEYLIYSLSISFVLAVIIHFVVSFKTKKEYLKITALILVLVVSFYGFYAFVQTPDCTQQMADLQVQLDESQKALESKQNEYLEYMAAYNKSYANSIEEIDAQIENLDATVSDLPIVFIGDSVMLGASYSFSIHFNNYYCDAKVSRSALSASSLVSECLNNGILANDIVIHLGANGGLSTYVMDEIRTIVGDERNIYWVTTTNDWQVYINDMIRSYCQSHDNTYVIDWESYSNGHTEYFWADGLHLPVVGREAYCDLVYQTILGVEYEQLVEQKAALEEAFNTEKAKTKSFFGGDVLIEFSENLAQNYPEAQISSKREYTFDDLKAAFESQISEDSLGRTVVLVLDKSLKLSVSEINALDNIIQNRKLVLVNIEANDLSNINSDIKLVDLSNVISIDNYLPDKEHLTEDSLQYIYDQIINHLE